MEREKNSNFLPLNPTDWSPILQECYKIPVFHHFLLGLMTLISRPRSAVDYQQVSPLMMTSWRSCLQIIMPRNLGMKEVN